MTNSDVPEAQARARRAKSDAHHSVDITVDRWFGGGQRLGYDPLTREIRSDGPLRVFVRAEGDLRHAVTLLPGFPDGSIGWAKVLPYLAAASEMPKLFVEYLGMGDSDKPKASRYSTAERTNLVEALWKYYGVTSTTLVAFDFSSLVVLEHLRRRLERAQRGEPAGGPQIRGVFIFNGGLYPEGHTHPFFTTPSLRLPGGAMVPWLAKRYFPLFRLLAGVMWSRAYGVSDDEMRRTYDAMNRHDGMFYLSRAAGFVAEHISEGTRLDFGRIYDAFRAQFPFLVGGSDHDPFEPRQVNLAEARLAESGLRIARLPGGHLTTTEHPEALAELINKFEVSVAPDPRK